MCTPAGVSQIKCGQKVNIPIFIHHKTTVNDEKEETKIKTCIIYVRSYISNEENHYIYMSSHIKKIF